MKSSSTLLTILYFLVTFPVAHAADASRDLPLVFDPQSKKYFIGGRSKFILKSSEKNALVDRIEVAIDGGDYKPYDQAIEFKEEGKHTLKFRAVNPVNNWSPVQYVEVFVDLNPPTTDANFDNDRFHREKEDLFVGLNSTISLASQDNLSGIGSIEYSWDGSTFVPYGKPILVDKRGKQTLYYRSTDKVGNVEPVKKMAFFADGTAPVSELKLGGTGKPTVVGGKTYVSDGVAFTVTGKDDQSNIRQVWVEIDGKSQPYIKPIYFLEEGAHTIGYYSVDNVGNKEAMKTMSVITVSTPPRTAAVPTGKSVNMGGVNYATRGFQLKLAAQDNVVGTERMEIKIDNDKDFHQYLEPVVFRDPGMHNVSYRAVDRCGNVEPARNYTVNIVDTVPETKLTTAQPLIQRDGVTYSPAPNVVTLSATESSGVGVEQTMISINDAAFTPYHGPITLDNAKVFKIKYKSVDKLGNEEQAKTVTFNMINSTPVVDLFISNGKSQEEQLRTNYLDQGTAPAVKHRAPASVEKKAGKDKKN